MRDLVYLAITFAFFGLCVAYVHLCDRIVGPEPEQQPAVERADRRRT